MGTVDCACGCGETFERVEGRGGAPRKYINRLHQRRARALAYYQRVKGPSPVIYREIECACGCGQRFDARVYSTGIRQKYVDRKHATVANVRAHRVRNPDAAPPSRAGYQRGYQLARFGLTPEQYDAILAAQGGGCAICGAPPGKRKLAVDHDHKCCPNLHACDNCRRGLLCTRCNTLLGHIDDDPQFLAKVFAYLEQHVTGRLH